MVVTSLIGAESSDMDMPTTCPMASLVNNGQLDPPTRQVQAENPSENPIYLEVPL